MADFDMIFNTTTGAVSGAQQGAEIGKMAGPKGAAAGAIIGGTIGGIRSYQANKKAKNSEVASTDPMEIQRLAELDTMRKNIGAGEDALTQNMLRQNALINAKTQNVIARNTGGNVQSTMDALLRSQGNAQRGINNTQAQSQQQLPFYENMYQGMMEKVSDRKRDLALMKSAEAKAKAAALNKENAVNFNAILGAGKGMSQGGAMGGSGGSGSPMDAILGKFGKTPGIVPDGTGAGASGAASSFQSTLNPNEAINQEAMGLNPEWMTALQSMPMIP